MWVEGAVGEGSGEVAECMDMRAVAAGYGAKSIGGLRGPEGSAGNG